MVHRPKTLTFISLQDYNASLPILAEIQLGLCNASLGLISISTSDNIYPDIPTVYPDNSFAPIFKEKLSYEFVIILGPEEYEIILIAWNLSDVPFYYTQITSKM